MSLSYHYLKISEIHYPRMMCVIAFVKVRLMKTFYILIFSVNKNNNLALMAH